MWIVRMDERFCVLRVDCHIVFLVSEKCPERFRTFRRDDAMLLQPHCDGAPLWGSK